MHKLILLAFIITIEWFDTSICLKTGGWHSIDQNDKSLNEVALFAANEVNNRTNSLYHKKLNRVISAERQVVAGYKYRIQFEIGTTQCKKNRVKNTEIEKCTNDESFVSIII